MRYKIQWRYVHNDVHVAAWEDIGLGLTDYPSPYAAYGALCTELACVPDRVGFTETPDLGLIRTDEDYSEASIFEHPQEQHYQYRIVRGAVETAAPERSRLIQL